jgi:hypothetical protein
MSNAVKWTRSEYNPNRITASNGRSPIDKGYLSVAIDKDKPSRFGGWTLRVWTANDFGRPVKVDPGFTSQLQAKLTAEQLVLASQADDLSSFDLATWLNVHYHNFLRTGLDTAWAIEDERANKRYAKAAAKRAAEWEDTKVRLGMV